MGKAFENIRLRGLFELGENGRLRVGGWCRATCIR